MRKNKIIAFISIILIVAMVMACAVGCKKSNDGDLNVDENFLGETVLLNGVDRGINFVVETDGEVADAESKIQVVKVISGEKIDVTVLESNGKLRVYPPVGYYELNQTYKISLTDKALKFEDYDAIVRNITFVVTTDSLSKIAMKDGLLTFDSECVSGQEEFFTVTDGEQQIGGTMQLQTNGVEVQKGDVILVNNTDTMLQEAYKVDSCYSVGGNAAAFIKYSKPQMNEIYNTFEVRETQALVEDSDIEFTYDEMEQVIENSELALAALQIFGSKPTFNFNISKANAADGKLLINAVVTMTIPNVVAIEGAIGADLNIQFNCLITVDANVNVNMAGEEVDCGVVAYVYNTVETTVSISTGFSTDQVTNLTELIEKANQLEEAETGVSVPMFTWVLPIANGAVSVRYQCDLHFAFAFSGAIGVKVTTDFDYALGATYSKEDGVETTAKILDSNVFKSVELKIEGSAKMKLGLANTLSLDVLAGVLSLGIKAEVGNFNGVYGYATTSNLVEKNPYITGAMYFEGGFYYDIDLIVALSIGSIANINKTIDIAQGEIVLYSFGERELIKSIESGKTIEMAAVEALIPEFVAVGYDLKSASEYETTVAFAEGVSEDSNLVVKDGKLTVVDPSKKVDTVVTFEYGNIKVTANVKFDGAVIFDKSVYEYDKSGGLRTVDLKVVLSGSEINGNENVEVEIGSYDKATKTVVIPFENVAVMENGVNEIQINVNGAVYTAFVNVSGKLEALGFEKNGVYEIFAAEQIADMSAKASAGEDFAGKMLKLMNDIDMDGAVIAPIKVFQGSLDGNGKTISNYTVEGVVDNAVAFIVKNVGVVKDLTLSGVVNAQIAAKTGNDYLVAGAVAYNLGRVTGVTVDGEINMTSTSLNAFVKITVMGVTAKNTGIVENNTAANASLVAVSQFDIANVTITVDGSIANRSCSCKNAAVSNGALVKFTVA